MRKIKVTLGTESASVALLEKEAPRTCDAIWTALPYETDVHHARICEHELIFMMPLIMEMENPVVPRVADVGYWVPRQCVNIWYGKNIPLGPTNLFGHVVENLEGFAKEATKVWVKPGALIKLSRVEE